MAKLLRPLWRGLPLALTALVVAALSHELRGFASGVLVGGACVLILTVRGLHA